jgi:uncharacterized protein YcbX
MLGEQVQTAELTERGLLGDRGYALVDVATGKVASAKNPRKWARLLSCWATYVEPPRKGLPLPPIFITLPDGTGISSEQPQVNEVLSRLLGREVVLRNTAPQTPSFEEYWPDIDGLPHRKVVTEEALALASPAGTFFDYAVVHLLTVNTLKRLQELYPEGQFDARRFRPNLVMQIASQEKDFLENTWLDQTLMVGEACLRVTLPCPRCVMTTLPQVDLHHDAGILRTPARYNQVNVPGYGLLPCVGVYADLVRPGIIRPGDLVIGESREDESLR